MKIETFSVTNYRSITTAHKITLGKYTVLIGKNNEGKTNILHALNLAMNILINHSWMYLDRSNIRVTSRTKILYNWQRDFPIQIQNRKNGLQSIFRLEFSLNESELTEFYKNMGSKLNGNIAIEIRIGKDNIPDIKIPKQGKNAKTLTKNSKKISGFISQKISINYIPAIRTENYALNEIKNTISEQLESIEKKQEYIDAINVINNLQQGVLDDIASKIKGPMQLFMPKIKDIKLKILQENRLHSLRKDIDLIVDDGNATSIEYKGDGVKSLASIAMLKDKRVYKSSPIIAIEEPESHLHPSAINQLTDVILGLSEKNQVIVTTHSPLLVARYNIFSNIIIDNGSAKPAKNIKEIRDVLGIKASDNLINAKYVLIVEGEDDKTSLVHILSLMSEKIQKNLKSNILSIQEIGGASNLSYKLATLKNMICTYHVLLDKDKAGYESYKKAQEDNLIDIKDVTFTNCNGMKEAEFEDCLKLNIYRENIAKNFGVDLKSCKAFNQNKKWSDRVKECFASSGKPYWTDTTEKKVKYFVAESITKCSNIDDILISQKCDFLYNLVNSLELLIDYDKSKM